MTRVSGMVAALLGMSAALAYGAVGGGTEPRDFGESVRGQELTAINVGSRDGERRVLVVGSIHGDEGEGHEIIRRLRRNRPSLGVALWTVKTVNPDGVDARTRVNARGVDLNRNFPFRWRADQPPGSGYYPGPEPASEPETRAAMRLIRHLDPRVTIWLHQPWGQVLAPCRGSAKPEKLYARIAQMPVNRCRGQRLPGTATSWQERRVGGTAFVVELDGGGARRRRGAPSRPGGGARRKPVRVRRGLGDRRRFGESAEPLVRTPRLALVVRGDRLDSIARAGLLTGN